LADHVAQVNAELQLAAIPAFSGLQHREAAVLKVLDAKAEQYLQLVEDEETQSAYLYLLVDFHRSISPRLAGTRYTDAASKEAQRLKRQLDERLQHWHDLAEMKAARQVVSIAQRHTSEATMPDLDNLLKPETNSQRRARVDAFLKECSKKAKFTIFRKHIWKLAGHKRSRQFEHWQACEPEATRADARNFDRILKLEPAKFISELKKRGIVGNND
jgi:hypothetical protein